MDSFSPYDNASNNGSNDGMKPVAIISQLLQDVASMQHIDEIFMWIASTIVQRAGMKSVQAWAMQADSRGVWRIKLRASSSQNYFQGQQMSENAEVSTLVARMIRERRGILSIPVSNIFSQYQATILAQQNCQYWTVYFLSKDVLLPPTQREFQREEIPTPFQMAFSLFAQQPLEISHARAISFLVEQALRIADSRGLFSSVTQQQTGPLPRKTEEGMRPVLTQIIPEHIRVTEIDQAENPFSNAVMIPEKRARQMYSLIDGKKSIAELAFLINMNQKEILEALQFFVRQGYITLRDARGNLIDISAILQFY
jgi:hypothetical protein